MLKFLKSFIEKKDVPSREALKNAAANNSSASLEATRACSETICALNAKMQASSQMESAAKRHITRKHKKGDWKTETSFGK